MSAIRLYVDEGAEQNALVAGLRSHEFDIVTAMEADMIGRTDREQLEYACQHERDLQSDAADFARLHAEYLQAAQPHFGTVLIPRQRAIPLARKSGDWRNSSARNPP